MRGGEEAVKEGEEGEGGGTRRGKRCPFSRLAAAIRLPRRSLLCLPRLQYFFLPLPLSALLLSFLLLLLLIMMMMSHCLPPHRPLALTSGGGGRREPRLHGPEARERPLDGGVGRLAARVVPALGRGL